MADKVGTDVDHQTPADRKLCPADVVEFLGEQFDVLRSVDLDSHSVGVELAVEVVATLAALHDALSRRHRQPDAS